MKNYLLFFLLLTFAKENLWAQVRFTVNSSIGCAPFTVEVTGNPDDPDYAASTETAYRFDDNLNWGALTTHTYTEPGTYVISQHLNTFDDKIRSHEITVIAGETPHFDYDRCNGRKITFTLQEPENYPAYSLNLGDGNIIKLFPNEFPFTHEYPNTAPRTVAVVGLINEDVPFGHAANDDCGVAVSFNVTPLDNLAPPSLNQVNVVDQNNIELSYNIIANIDYQVEMSINGAAFNPIGRPSTTGSFAATGLDTEQNYYCFRISMKDPCDNTVPDEYSGTICTAITSVEDENNQNVISWNTNALGLQRVEIWDGNNLVTTQFANIGSFPDTEIVCNVEYCYQVRLFYNNNSFSTNEVKCVIGVTENTPPVLENATASVTGNDVLLEWPPALSVKEYHVEKSTDDGSYERIYSSETNVFLDQDVDITSNYHCYRVLYEDQCGNIAPLSVAICPVLLTVSPNELHSYELTWTHYLGWQEGVSHYIIDKIDKDGNTIESIEVNSGTNSYIDDNNNEERQIILYRITAVPNNSVNERSFSNIVRIEQVVKVFLPTAFTPNGDQLNDVFIAKGTFIKELQMKIFNRWGELLFYSNDKAIGWDGNYRGSPVQEGSYVYTLQVTDYNDKTISLSGAFMLIRNRKF